MIEVYFIAMIVILTWYNHGMDLPKPIRLLRLKLSYKPFNCLWCLSFWVGAILSVCTLNLLFISLPLATYYFNDDRR